MSIEEKLEFLKEEIALEFDHYDCAIESHDNTKKYYHKGIIDGMARVVKYLERNVYDTRSYT